MLLTMQIALALSIAASAAFLVLFFAALLNSGSGARLVRPLLLLSKFMGALSWLSAFVAAWISIAALINAAEDSQITTPSGREVPVVCI